MFVGTSILVCSENDDEMTMLSTIVCIAWGSPFQIFLALVLLWKTMGPSIWSGVAILILAIPLNGYLASRMMKLQKQQMKNKDARVKLMVNWE